MTVPKTEPAPRRNRTSAGSLSRLSGIVAADIAVALGDFTGGASEDLFTLTSHGFVNGDAVYVLWQTAQGTVTGGEGTRAVIKSLSSSTFQLTTDGTTTIENTADGSVLLLRANAVPQRVADQVINSIICGVNDTTGGTVEDMMTAVNGLKGAIDGDTIKLLYKSAAGVAGTADATVYVKSPVTPAATGSAAYFQTAATSGGAVVDTTSDGTYVFLKTS